MTRLTLPASPAIPGLAARTFDPGADYPAVADLMVATSLHDGVSFAPSAASLAHEWSHEESMDPARDVAVVEIHDTIVAVAEVSWRQRDAKVVNHVSVVVRPEHRRRGIGTALLGWAEAHARAMVAEGRGGPTDLPHHLGGWTDIGVPGVLDFAAVHGYVPVRYFSLMIRDLREPIPDLPMPAGLEVRPVVEADHRRIWDADEEAFLDHFEAGVRTEGDFVAFFSAPDLRTDLWQVAWEGGEVAGSVVNTIYPEENERLGVSRGWLDHVSVRRPWRGRGLASALIARSLVTFRDLGLAEAILGVDAENPTGALGVYERLGFRRDRASAAFRKPF